MPRVKFNRDYNHRWPSKAVTAFKAGWIGSVKREVAEAAIAKGSATEAPRNAKPRADGRHPDIGRSGFVAGPDHADDVGADVRNPLLDGAGE